MKTQGTDTIAHYIVALLGQCSPAPVTDCDANLFDRQIGFQACDMTYVLRKLHQQYQLPVRSLVSAIKTYSVNGIASSVHALLQDAEM